MGIDGLFPWENRTKSPSIDDQWGYLATWESSRWSAKWWRPSRNLLWARSPFLPCLEKYVGLVRMMWKYHNPYGDFSVGIAKSRLVDFHHSKRFQLWSSFRPKSTRTPTCQSTCARWISFRFLASCDGIWICCQGISGSHQKMEIKKGLWQAKKMQRLCRHVLGWVLSTEGRLLIAQRSRACCIGRSKQAILFLVNLCSSNFLFGKQVSENISNELSLYPHSSPFNCHRHAIWMEPQLFKPEL